MEKTPKFEIPKDGEVIDADWRDDVAPEPDDFQLYGGDEQGEIAYSKQKEATQKATPVNKSEAKGASLKYKGKKIGQKALFAAGDKLAA